MDLGGPTGPQSKKLVETLGWDWMPKFGKSQNWLAERAERSFHKHNEIVVLSSVSSVSPSLRTVGRNFSVQPASKTSLRPTYRAPCKLRAVFGRLGTLGKSGRLSSSGEIWDLPDLPKCSI
jgi:hypothetical protein